MRRAGIAVLLACGIVIFGIIVAGIFVLPTGYSARGETVTRVTADIISLPKPRDTGDISVEEALAGRRSVREYAATPPDIADISRLLWAAQGVTSPGGFRTAPSAGALYPLEIYVTVGNVTGLPAGVYHYLPESHALEQVSGRDVREELYKSALLQAPVRDAPAVIVIAADYNRTTQKYGDRGIRYVHLEAGHAAQNIYLQAYTLGIGTVAIGAFDDSGARSALRLPPGQTPLCLMPLGKMRIPTVLALPA